MVNAHKIFIDTDHGSWDSAGGATWQSGTPCSTWACRMDLEKELLDAFDRVVHEDFLNPQRLDCPGRQALLKLAQQPADAQLAHLLDHTSDRSGCGRRIATTSQSHRIFQG